VADERDRASIYGIRHQVYAQELNSIRRTGGLPHRQARRDQHVPRGKARGARSQVRRGDAAPTAFGYSLDKYFARERLPLVFDRGRLRSSPPDRHFSQPCSQVAMLLMYAALRYVETLGATTVAAIGPLEVLDIVQARGPQVSRFANEIWRGDLRADRGRRRRPPSPHPQVRGHALTWSESRTGSSLVCRFAATIIPNEVLESATSSRAGTQIQHHQCQCAHTKIPRRRSSKSRKY